MNEYNVLWVDDEVNPHMIEEAKRYGLEVTQFTSWDLGRGALGDKSLTWDAIILDGNCVLNDGEQKNSDFLYQAVSEMREVMVTRGISIPWYVLSSGTAADYKKTLARIGMGERDRMTEHWGRMAFNKTNEEVAELFTCICRAASQSPENKIRHIYANVFDALDEHFDQRASEVMMTILMALHYPEENRRFDPVAYYTQMRRILEYLFRAANKIGVLPDEMLLDNKINLTNSSCYLDGQEVNIGHKTILQVNREVGRIFPPIIAGIVKKIINIANKQTHTSDITKEEEDILNDYYKMVGSSNMLFGFALQLCDVISWFGTYAKAHPDIVANRKTCFKKRAYEPRHEYVAPKEPQNANTTRPPQRKSKPYKKDTFAKHKTHNKSEL